MCGGGVVTDVLTLMSQVSLCSVGDGARPPGGGPLRLLARLSQQWGRGGGRVGAALSVTRSHEAEVRVTAAVC